MSLHLKPGQLTLADLRQAYLAPVRLSLDPSADAPIAASVACVENIIAEGRTAYGINTGFGLLASTRISPADLEKLQRSIVLSHAAGVGEALDDAMVRLVMLLKVNSLARGFSGIRRKVIDALIALINAEVYPHIPLKGSVGASGDLAPLAHMSLVLIGESRARHRGEWLPAAEALAVAGLEPLTLAAKEGLALLKWHPGVHRLRAARVVRGRGPVRRRHRLRRAQRRGHARFAGAVRCAHPRRARPAWADRRGRGLSRPAHRQQRGGAFP